MGDGSSMRRVDGHHTHLTTEEFNVLVLLNNTGPLHGKEIPIRKSTDLREDSRLRWRCPGYHPVFPIRVLEEDRGDAPAGQAGAAQFLPEHVAQGHDIK